MIQPYKTYILALLLVLCGSILEMKAQSASPSYTLQADESGASKTYVARDYVSLKPGFRYAASSGNSFNAKINPYLIDTVPLSGQVLDNTNSYVVGGINGSASVAPSGAAIYEVPIKVPQGTGGMAPQLSIVYNSQGSDGLLGIGFSMDGLSSITRVANGKRDGEARPVSLDEGDKFALDGNRLVAISGAYGADGTEYRTENNSFSKIISYTTTTTGPESFIVYTKSGLIYEYGKTSDSKFKIGNCERVIVWLLNKVTDTKGNYYTITYAQDRVYGEYCPIRIDYTGNNNSNPVLSPYCSIQFLYTKREAHSVVSIGGQNSRISKLLSSIDIYNENKVVKKYKIEYDTKDYEKYLVSTITESGNDSKNIPPLHFNWYLNNVYSPYAYLADIGPEDQKYVRSDSEIYPGDFDGDGKTEFIAIPKSGTYANQWNLIDYLDYTNIDPRCVERGPLVDGYEKIYVGDFNGDGKSDIIQKGMLSRYTIFNYVKNQGFVPSQTIADPFSTFPLYPSDNELLVGEFNNDGISDFIIYKKKL
jgi:hypothetical protein